MVRSQGWTIPLRTALALMWIVHGLEKFGVKWPLPIAGGTQSVAGMLGFMADETPLSFLRQGIETFMLPYAKLMQYPVGAIELVIGLAIASGLLLPWAALIGAALQAFIWLGFLSVVWPLQYPLVILLHLTLLASPLDRQPNRWKQKFARAALILLPLMLGVLIMAYRSDWFGYWPWNYYLVGAAYASLLLVGHGGRSQTAFDSARKA